MNYFKIGEKIRKYRKSKSMSQEELAEKIGISVTHMSHIETGNTKLSLPVFVKLASALEVQTDDLLYEVQKSKAAPEGALYELASECTKEELQVILDIARATKAAIEKHL
ncbi:MAG: helix-turn-helix transcriptional regulator [Clostridia bacterium]|nr:helix-turn-helix transcriptional regulator [Clostridia bacterium]